MGSEIKSLRDGRVDISESFAREENNEIFLILMRVMVLIFLYLVQ